MKVNELFAEFTNRLLIIPFTICFIYSREPNM